MFELMLHNVETLTFIYFTVQSFIAIVYSTQAWDIPGITIKRMEHQFPQQAYLPPGNLLMIFDLCYSCCW